MNTQTHTQTYRQTQTHVASAISNFVFTLAQVLTETMQALEMAWRENRQRALARSEFAQLDAHALRDLGMCRSEFDSIDAESRVRVELTRRRVALPWRD